MSSHHGDWKDADWKETAHHGGDWKEEPWSTWHSDSWYGRWGDKSEKSHGWGAKSARTGGSGWRVGSQDWHEHDWHSQAWSSNWAASEASHRGKQHAGMSTSPQVREADTPEIAATSTVVPCAGSDAGDVQIVSEQASAKMADLLETVKCTKGARGDSFDNLPVMQDAVAIESDHRHGFRVRISLPPTSKINDPLCSSWQASVFEAWREAPALIAKAQDSLGLVRCLQESAVEENWSGQVVEESIPPAMPLPFDMLHLQDLSTNVQPWPSKLRVLSIDTHFAGGSKDRRFGLLTTLSTSDHISFHLSLGLARSPGWPCGLARLVAHEVDWPPTAGKSEGCASLPENPSDSIQRYHKIAMRAYFHEQELHPYKSGAALLVRLRLAQESAKGSDEFDWDAMDEVCAISRVHALFAEDEKELGHGEASVPTSQLEDSRFEKVAWLEPVLRQWFWLHHLQAVSLKLGPAFPVLDPLAMESVLMPPHAEHEAQVILQHVGNKVLQIIASMAVYDQGRDHNSMVRQALLQCMTAPPAQILHRIALAYAEDKHVSPLGGTQILNALFGRYFLYEGGGFYAVWRVLRWLLSFAPDGESIWGCDTRQLDDLETTLGYYCFGNKPYQGRTPTYTSFKEVEEPETDCRQLEVTYSNGQAGGFTGRAMYRRSSAADGLYPGHVQERILPNGDWTPLPYSPHHGTFISNLVLLAHIGNLEAAPGFCAVPTKVAYWCCGKPSCCLVKQAKQGRKDGTQGAEMQLLQERPDGVLMVKYASADYGWLCVLRGTDGNMGLERRKDSSETRPIFWSEELKMLMSSFTSLPVPRMVADWLRTNKSLAMLISPQKSNHCAQDPKKTVEQVDNESAQWSYQGRTFTCMCERTHGGCVFLEAEAGPRSRVEPLIYSMQDACWLSPLIHKQCPPGTLEAQLPHGIRQWINECRKRSEDTPEKTWTTLSQAPWLQISLRGSLASTVLGAELVLNHTFRNQRLLLEAYTPGVHSKLAAFGARLLEALLAEHLVYKHLKLQFQLLTLRGLAAEQHRDAAASATSSASTLESFAVPRLSSPDGPRETFEWPELPSWTQAADPEHVDENVCNDIPIHSASSFQCILDACNNNVVYAYACVNLGLHTYIAGGSSELHDAAKRFALCAPEGGPGHPPSTHAE